MTKGRTSSATLAAASRTDPGRVRGNNEDLPICDPDRGVYAVIDGVGGQAAGEVAARIALDVINKRLQRPLGAPAERVREAIALANNEIFKEADESPARHGMTCVVTLALVTDHRLTIGHVGDSRLYKLFPDGIRKLTHDHSPIGEREDAQEISEVEAMHHPRRNEVFRDVGSHHRDKDDEDFVDIVEDTFENDCAMLLCTDGLSDMVPSSIIEHLVKQHAGDPQAVVDALVTAANEAGGKDNITVVYAEAPEFVRAVRGAGAPALSLGAGADTRVGRYMSSVEPISSAASTIPSVRAPLPVPGQSRGAQFTDWARRSRTTWFAWGTLVGVVAALALVWRLGSVTAPGRTLVVGGSGQQAFANIGDAMAAAHPGDVVQLEPGIYREQVVVPDGVDLVARLAGKATLARGDGSSTSVTVDFSTALAAGASTALAANPSGSWTALTAAGRTGGRVYGIRIESTAGAPIDVGIRISGQGHQIELVDVSGPMRAAIELADATAVTIRGSLIHTGPGPAITIDDRSEATIVNNSFIRAGGSAEPALSLKDARRTVVTRNVFMGYGAGFVRGVPADERPHLGADNFVVGPEPTSVR